MNKLLIATIIAVFVGVSIQCSAPSSHCSQACPTTFPSSGKCSFTSIIAKHEGCCQCAYLDSLGKPTIGIGYLLVPSRTSQLQSVGANYNSIVAGQSSLNNEQIVSLFNTYVQSSIAVAQKTYSNWNQLCCNVEQALIDIIYDLNNGISAFHNFNAAIVAGNWNSAAANLESSLFCKQVGHRCTDDAQLIKQGCSGTAAHANKENNEEHSNKESSAPAASNKESSAPASNQEATAPASTQASTQQATAPASSQASSAPASTQASNASTQASNASTQQATAPASTQSNQESTQQESAPSSSAKSTKTTTKTSSN